MKFHSPEFLVFFFTVALASRWAPHRLRIWGLLAASLFFYAWWSVAFVPLLLFSVLLDYWVGLRLGVEKGAGRRKALLFLSLAGNLGTLITFKYLDLLLRALHLGTAWATGAREPILAGLILPLGISFYTFQSMSYTIDVYRRRLAPCHDFPAFALFVTFFPQLVAGPIVRASDLLHQLQRGPDHDEGRFREGFPLMAWGFVKKMVLADRAAPFVDAVFGNPLAYGGTDVALGVYSFALQVYCDFSGYTDIAIGCARILGFRIPANFDSPYLAASLRDFWRRWHISLSTWLRDYLYIPLGGNRTAVRMRDRNLMVTMLLGGLWHGAAWHFVLWGGFHGLLLVLEKRLGRFGRVLRSSRPGRVAAILLTFHLVLLGWILFRADGLPVALAVLTRGLSFAPGSLEFGRLVFVLLAGLGVVVWVEARHPFRRILTESPFAATVATWAGAVAAVILGPTAAVPFIYFQF